MIEYYVIIINMYYIMGGGVRWLDVYSCGVYGAISIGDCVLVVFNLFYLCRRWGLY